TTRHPTPFPTRRSSDLRLRKVRGRRHPHPHRRLHPLPRAGHQKGPEQRQEMSSRGLLVTALALSIDNLAVGFALANAVTSKPRRSEEHTSELQSRFDLV